MPSDEGRPALSPATVLLVEDETLIRMLLAEELEDAGYRVIEAGSADDAIDLLAAAAVDLVVTDVKMPGARSGLDLAAWVRGNRPAAKVVVMSGYVHEEVVSAAGIDAFVSKPFKPVDVAAVVERLLSAG